VYILYLLFQLKSHAYIYESTPQYMIDEESHPGVLAEILNSSSSSDTSSDDDSDASSGSNTTVKRIRRALRKTRRRKSSSASKETNSVPSPPSFVRTASSGSQVIDMQFPTHAIDELSRTGLEPEQHGEATVTGQASAGGLHPSLEVTSRDFETDQATRGPGDSARKSTRKSTRKSHRWSKHRRNRKASEHEGECDDEVPPTAAADKSQHRHLRRTNSLPDRLNVQTVATAIPSAQPLPHLLSKTRVETKDDSEEKPKLSRTSAMVLLLVTTGLVAVCAEFLVDSIDYLVQTSGVSQAFIGLIILPIVGNAAEHVTAVTVASKNKMDLAIGVALGSSIQIALFVTPVIVLLGWILNTDMSLYFSLFETISLFASAFIVNYLMLDGRTNYLEGALLIAAYVIIAVAAFFYPSCEDTSTVNGGPTNGSCR
jgi:Ca2+:H+ antiporter